LLTLAGEMALTTGGVPSRRKLATAPAESLMSVFGPCSARTDAVRVSAVDEANEALRHKADEAEGTSVWCAVRF
jgi:hypothetical protein